MIKKFAWYGSSVAFAALLAVAILVASPAGTAFAANSTIPDEVPADGVSTATISIDKLYGDPAVDIAAGDSVTVSTNLGTFDNGSTVQTKVSSGTAAVTFKLKSSTTGAATVNFSMNDASAGTVGTIANATVTFYGAPSLTGAATTLTVDDNAVVNNTTSQAVANSNAIVFTVEDASNVDISGAPYTMTLTGGATFSVSGTDTIAGLLSDGGAAAATNITIPTGAYNGTLTATVNAKTGSLTIVGTIHRGGNPVTAEAVMNGSSPAGGTANGTNKTLKITDDNQTNVELFTVTVKDSAGNKVNHAGAKAASCTGTDQDGTGTGNITSNVTLEDPTAGASTGTYVIEMNTANAVGGSVTCTWALAASGSTNPALSGTAEFTVQTGATASSLVVTLPDGALKVNPGIPVVVTAKLLDSVGTQLVTSNGDTTTFAVNGTTGGNLFVSGSNVAHTHGVATAVFVPGDALGTFTITAITAGGKSGFVVVTVTDESTTTTPTPTPSGDGTMTAPTFGTGDVGSAVFDGGTIEELSAAVTAAGGTSVWAQTSSGTWVRYNTQATGATAFVNNAFNEAFAAGFAGPTAVFVVK